MDLILSYLLCFANLIWRPGLLRPVRCCPGNTQMFKLHLCNAFWHGSLKPILVFNWQPASHECRKQIASLLNRQTRYWYNNSGQAAGSRAVSLSHTNKSAVHIQAPSVASISWEGHRGAWRTALRGSQGCYYLLLKERVLFYGGDWPARQARQPKCSIFISLSSNTLRHPVLLFRVTYTDSQL